MPLTDALIKQLKPPKDTGKHFDGHGLYLELAATGRKYWRLKYRFAGKENRLALGVYPEVTLKAARDQREAARKLLAAGTDPSQQRKLDKIALSIAASDTFEGMAREWLKVKSSGWSPIHTRTTLERMELNLFPWIGKRTLTEITIPELLVTLRRVESRGAVETAHRLQSILSQVFRFAIATGRAASNPAADLSAGLKTITKGNHPAIVEPVRFAALLRDAHAYGGSAITRAALQIHALTCQRPGEVAGMAWSEVDLDAALWLIPGERMKRTLKGKANGQPHAVPLSKQAVSVLKGLQPLTGSGPLVFPSERGQGRRISENTVRLALRSMGYTDHVPHGFRASIRTMAREYLHADNEVIERLLAHGSTENLGGAYDRTQFLKQRVELVQQWADWLDVLRTGGNVVQLKVA